jgi:hypothetical protein
MNKIQVIKRVGMREFRKNLKKYLKELPIFITHHGEDIAFIKKVKEER